VLEYNTDVQLCQFFGFDGKQFYINIGIGVWRSPPKGTVSKIPAKILLNSSKREFPPNCQNWVPAKRYSTKNIKQNTNHQVPVPVTYQYQPDSQYW
jgi:hypothetical protein